MMAGAVSMEIRFGSVAEGLLLGRAGPRALAAARREVRRALAAIQKHHKTQEMIRGGGAPVSDRLTVRTGELSRSYRIYMATSRLEGAYGSELARARIQEEGGTITPKRGRSLAIPTEHALTHGKMALWPSDYPPGALFRLGRTLYMAKKFAKRSDLVPMFHLVPNVKVRPRPGLERTRQVMEPVVAQYMADALEKAVLGNA